MSRFARTLLISALTLSGGAGLALAQDKDTVGKPAGEATQPKAEKKKLTVGDVPLLSAGAIGGRDIVGGGAEGFGAVSATVGAVLVVEVQPGMANTRTSRNTWMPTTTPKIFRIFIGGMS